MERKIDYRQIGKRLKTLREAHKLTQSQLAETVGCSDGYISQVERSICNPSLEFLVQLSALYHLPVDSLLLDSDYVLPEIKIEGRLKDQLARATPATLQAISEMVDILLSMQENSQE